MTRSRIAHLVVLALAVLTGLATAVESPPAGRWMAGDFHQHTYFTDGSHSISQVLLKGFEYGLDWEANSEHGGASRRDEQGREWNEYPDETFKGDERVAERKVERNGAEVVERRRVMWRWQTLVEFAFRAIQRVRGERPDKLVATGLEWNVPGHEHCSVGIVADDAMPIGEFEYRFDRGDGDSSGGPGGAWEGKRFDQNEHAKAVAAVEWMQENHADGGWIVFAHPERASSYSVADFRDFHDAGPTVVFGFEGLPGHQRSGRRGGYRERAVGGGTYGGAGWYIAEVGGLWDALLGEGRQWWTFVSSDFHSLSSDYWPGQYAKTWTYVADGDRDGAYTLADVPGGLRSGNTFCVHGDLIDRLDFRLTAGEGEATMGQTLEAPRGAPVEMKLRFRSPSRNARSDKPEVRAVQVITGSVRGKVSKFLADGTTPNPAYSNDRNGTAKVAALYVESDLRETADGWIETPVFRIPELDGDLYVRVRGSSLPPNTALETDARGNPLADSLVENESDLTPNEAAWRDLWFYSNPVFVRAK